MLCGIFQKMNSGSRQARRSEYERIVPPFCVTTHGATFIAAVLIILALISSVQAMVPAAAGVADRSEHNVPRERVLLVAQEEKSLPIAMKCPLDNNGAFELLFKDLSGFTVRYQVVLDENTATTVLIEVAEKGKLFERDFFADLRTVEDPEAVHVANRVLGMARKVLDNVCNGTPFEKDRFKKFLSENRKEVGG